MRFDPEVVVQDLTFGTLRFPQQPLMVFQNRIMAPFMAAVPGLHDLVQLGKIFDLECRADRSGRRQWDLIVVDAPATGHGLTMLGAPRSMMALTGAGPFHDNADRVRQLIEDPDRTSLVLVSLPEELPVNETLELHHRLGDLSGQVGLCVLNEIHPEPFEDLDAWPGLRPHFEGGPPELTEALRFADRGVSRAHSQRSARERLRTGLDLPHVELPFLFKRSLGPEELSALGRRLLGGS